MDKYTFANMLADFLGANLSGTPPSSGHACFHTLPSKSKILMKRLVRSGAAGSGGPPFMGKGVLPNGPAAPSLENHFHGPALQRINARGRTVGIAAGASQYEPPVAARAPTLFYAGASCFSAFPAPREVAGPLLWEKGSCQMGPQRRVWKITREIFLLKSLKFRREDHW